MTLRNLIQMPLHLLRGIAVALVAGMTLVITGRVLARALGVTPAGATELATLMFLWVIYLGLFLALIEGGHLGITLIVSRLRGRLLTATLCLSDALLLLFLVALAVASTQYIDVALDSTRLTPELRISPAWGYGSILVGTLLSVLYVGGVLVVNLGRLWTGREPVQLHHSDLDLQDE